MFLFVRVFLLSSANVLRLEEGVVVVVVVVFLLG